VSEDQREHLSLRSRVVDHALARLRLLNRASRAINAQVLPAELAPAKLAMSEFQTARLQSTKLGPDLRAERGRNW
jgi:hypothetical protein